MTNSSSQPLEGIEVCVAPSGFEEAFEEEGEEVTGEEFSCDSTNTRGEYVISGLPEGTYDVEFSSQPESEPGYVTQYWEDAESSRDATAVRVTGGTVGGIDAILQVGAQLTGEVTRAVGGAPIEGIEVCAFEAQAEGYGCAETKADGRYTITGLASGEYQVEFGSPPESGVDYVLQYWDDQPALASAEAVDLRAPERLSGIDAEMQEGGRIEGVVTNASTHEALSDVLVCAHDTSEKTGSRCALTNGEGEYTIEALRSGDYDVDFFSSKAYVLEYYDDSASSAGAMQVVVAAPGTAVGIDAALQPVATAPANSSPPSILGNTAVGSTLLCAPGRWTGKPAPTYSYQWLRNGAAITTASGSSYVVQSADAGSNLSCGVTARNSAGEQSATSASVAIPAPTPSSPPAPAHSSAVPDISIKRARLSAKGAEVQILCSDAACSGSVTVTLKVTIRRKKDHRVIIERRRLVLAKGSYTLAQGKGETLALHLTREGRKRLAHVTHRPLATALTATVNDGRSVTATVKAG